MTPDPVRSPTLLVFTLGSVCESRRRHLLPAGLRAMEERLHRTCLDTTLDAGRAVGCRLEVSSPAGLELPPDVTLREQTGRDFGARLTRAVAETWAVRSGPMVLVGSDVPDLRARHVRKALDLIEDDPDRVVIGPSPDGGFYLLASARPLDSTLASVAWRSRATLASLRRALAREGRDVVLLEPLADLDRPADLERWLATRRAMPSSALRTIREVLSALLAEQRAPTSAPFFTPAKAPVFSAHRTRAPPVAA